jgi:hypothetical protein
MYKRACGYSHPEIKLNVIDNEIVQTELVKHYPPDRAAGQEFLDRTEGKVIEKRELTGKDGKPLETVTTVETGPGVSRVLQALETATTNRTNSGDERGNKE